MTTKLKGVLALFIAFVFALVLVSVVAFADDSVDDTVTVTYDVTYCQTEARSMLDMINEFRTDSNEAWYWDSTDTEKTYVTLSELTYDYDLEEIAMQRAAEIAVSYSHTRPNGSTCWTAYDGVYVWTEAAENIAAGQTTAEAAFEQWQEEDESYSDQGHRRNMLSSSLTSVGIACVYYDGYYYWVQDFGSSSSSANTTATIANNSVTSVAVEVAKDYISDGSLSLSDDSITLQKGDTADLPEVTLTASISSHWPSAKKVSGIVSEDNVTWQSADTSIASVGSIVANSVGTTMFTATVADSYTAELTVTVEGVSIASFTATLSQDEYEYNGTAQTPSVTVSDASGNALTEGTDYTVSYSDNTQVGTATVTITGTGDYTGTITKTFTIKECSHTYTSVVTKEATCSEEGVKTYTCSKCSDTYTEAIEKTAHTESGAVKENNVDATCEEVGSYDAVVYCTVCGEEISRTTVTTDDAIGHSYDYENITWEWSNDYSSAKATVVCSNDESHTLTYEAEIDASADSATCEDGGTITYMASTTIDGTTYTDTKEVETEATGHVWDSGTVTDAATCTDAGTMTYVCENNSDHTKTETIAALGHSWQISWGDWYESDDGWTCTATLTCANDATHVLSGTVSVTSETSEGTTVYTAMATFDGVDTTYTNGVTKTVESTNDTNTDATDDTDSTDGDTTESGTTGDTTNSTDNDTDTTDGTVGNTDDDADTSTTDDAASVTDDGAEDTGTTDDDEEGTDTDADSADSEDTENDEGDENTDETLADTSDTTAPLAAGAAGAALVALAAGAVALRRRAA